MEQYMSKLVFGKLTGHSSFHLVGRQEYVPPLIARSLDRLYHSDSARRTARLFRNGASLASWSSKVRGMESSVCDAPISAETTTVEVTQRNKAEMATLCASMFTQLFGPGSEEAALTSEMTQPPMKNSSASTTGSVFVCRSAAR